VGAILGCAGATVCPRYKQRCIPNVRTGTIAGNSLEQSRCLLAATLLQVAPGSKWACSKSP